MPPAEIAWRLRSAARDIADRYRLPRGLYPQSGVVNRARSPFVEPRFHVSNIEKGSWNAADSDTPEALWRDALVERADEIRQHRLSFLGLSRCYLGNPIDWNRDHALGVATAMALATTIDYRDVREAGDCKLVWEPSRHQHLVVLARAFRATGDEGYFREIVDQLASWLDQCPFGWGMQWRSPLELSVRLINWVWTLDLVGGVKVLPSELCPRVVHSAYLHLWEIARKYSKYSSANNHTIGEAAGVFIGASYFDQFREAPDWRAGAKEILEREILAQTYADGCTREQALGYQLFVVQFFVLAGVVARRCGDDFSDAYWQRLERMFEFIAGAEEAGGTPPAFGDADDGYVIDLGGSALDTRWLLNLGGALFERVDFVRPLATTEPVRWLLDRSAPNPLPRRPPLKSRAFPNSGYYLLQSDVDGVAISVWFDCGELGLGSIAAHGHADALSVTVRAFGEDVLVDPGTYDYFTHPEWRRYFRSTRSRNTIEVDDLDQSTMSGPFMWSQRAQTKLVEWQPSESGGTIVGEHDGYERLADPVRHRRTVRLDGQNGCVVFVDELRAACSHRVAQWFHFAPGCRIKRVREKEFELSLAQATLRFRLDPRVTCEEFEGSENPIAGWYSRSYHVKTPTRTIAARVRVTEPVQLTTLLEIVR